MHRGTLVWLLVSLAATPAAADPPRLRVLTYNIHHGEGTDGRIDLPRLARVISGCRPDLVALQEVDRGTRRAGGVDQPAELARLTGLQAWFAKAMDYDGGEYGEAVLSKHRLLETRALALPHRPGSEPRAAAVVRVRPDGFASDLTLLATHLDHLEDESDRVAQARELLRVGGELGKAALLAGDLNALPESAPMRLLLADWRDTAPPQAPATWPSHEPTQRIDYVLVPRGGPWGVVESQVLEEQVASDHRPLLVVLERKGED